MVGISPRPIDFLLLWLWASGTDEGHPRANATYAKERPGNGMASGLLHENNLASPSLNQTRNTYGLVGVAYPRTPWLMGGKGLICSETPPLVFQSPHSCRNGRDAEMYAASKDSSLLRKPALPATAAPYSPVPKACQDQGATLTRRLMGGLPRPSELLEQVGPLQREWRTLGTVRANFSLSKSRHLKETWGNTNQKWVSS